MRMATRLLIILIAGAVAMPARAATTVYPASVYSSSGVANPLNALGPVNGASALIANGGEIVLQYLHPLTGGGIAATFLPIASGVNVIAASIGEIVSGTAVFSGEFLLVDLGAGGVLNADLSALCSTVSATGCSLIKFRNAAALFGSAGFALDGVSGVSNAPEPSVWALMIVAFIGVAARLKTARRKDVRRPLRGGMLSLA